jgi:F-type H+-transporting ATPase subunit b
VSRRIGTSRSLAALLLLAVCLLAGGLAPVVAQEHGAPAQHAEPAAAEHGEGAGEHGGAQEGAQEDAHADTWLGLPRPIFLAINLLAFFAILVRFAGPALMAFLADKQREIQHALAEADRQREEAAGMEARLAAQIAELRREVEELAERSAREAERERQEILAEAERDRERLESSARAEIEQGLLQAQQRLTAHAAALATQLAEERLASGLTREDRKRLFRDNLRKLEGRSA